MNATARKIPKSERLVIALLTLQIAVPLAAMLLHPGFDHKNSLGMDFDHLITMAVVAGFAWIAGLVFSLQLEARKGVYCLGHVGSLGFGVLCFFFA